MAPASGAWAGMEEPGGAATAQLLLAGSRGPNVAQPGELQGRRANSALLAFLCAPGTRTAEPWAQERSDPAASSQTPLPSIALSPASTQPGCRPARATGLVVTPQSSLHLPLPEPGAPWLKLPQCPISLTLERTQRRERKRSCFSSWSLMVLSPLPLQHITPQAVWRQWCVRRFESPE